MIDEDELRTMLAAEADRYDVPPEGMDALRATLRGDSGTAGVEPVPGVSWAAGSEKSGFRRRSMVLTGVAAAAVLALLVGILGHSGGTKSSSGGADRASSRANSLSKLDANSKGTLEDKAATKDQALSSTSARRAAGGPPTTVPSAAPLAPRAPSAGGQGSKRSVKDSAAAEKIVKTGSIELRVPRRKFPDRIVRLTSLANGLGGFVAETSTSEQGASPSGTITLRVPSGRFEELLVQVRRLGQVRAATTGSQDVTSEFTDVVGRLRTMKNEREQLSLVLTRAAQNVPDILSVRDRLNAVQAEIEQLEGRRKVLEDQTSLATLTVALSEPGATKPLARPHPRSKQSGLIRAWHEGVDGFTGGIEAIIAGSGKVLLVLLCAGALWLLGIPLLRRVRRSLV